MNLKTLRISLRSKIIGGIVLLCVLVGGFVYVYFPNRQQSQALEARQVEVQRLAVILSQSVVTGVEFEDTETIEDGLGGAKSREDVVAIHVLGASGNDLYAYTQKFDNEAMDLSKRKTHSAEVKVFSGDDAVGLLKLTMSMDDLIQQGNANRSAVLLVSALIIGVGGLFGMYLSRIVLNPMARVNAIIQMVAEGDGDLTQRIQIESNDEIGDFANGFNYFLDKLADLVIRVKGSTEKVASAAEQISNISAQLAAGAEEQTSQTSEVAASVQEMTATIVENSKNANQTAQISEEANLKATEGSEAMKATQDGMEGIVNTSNRTGQIIDSLSGRADQIGAIIQVIDDIAEQTNLLALNAAIEAARAGEQGRGFAVVADEVRKLAERTTKATAEISETINAIQSDTRDATSSMNEVNNVVNEGKQATLKTENVLCNIIQSVTHAMEMISQIATASEEMSAGAEEISKNVDSISQVTKESSDGAEQMAATAEQLNVQTKELRLLVNQFKVNDKSAHHSANSGQNDGLSLVGVGEKGRIELTTA